MTDIIIYHNPNCGTSRNTLAMIRNNGIEPRVIEYLKAPPSRAELVTMLAAIGKPVRDVLRNKDSLYAELDLDNPKWSDNELIDFVIANPILINRPIVVTSLGTRLCRPPETVLEILPMP
jgi:arsenate reductase